MAITRRRPRLTLLPGTPVVARAPGVLQVGLTGPTLRLADRPEVRRLLADLAAARVPTPDRLEPVAATALERLLGAGLARETHADEDLVRRRARAAAPVGLDLPPGQPALAAQVTALLDHAGLRPAGREDDPAPARVHLVVATGPIGRDRLDPLVRASLPHLLVTGDARGVRVGPFVVPGRTACLRCVDAHEALHDERLPLLLAQAAAQAADDPPPRDPVLDQLALAWAVRDLTCFADGEEPGTWSATVDLPPTGAPTVTAWGRHPYCGCAWDGFLDLP